MRLRLLLFTLWLIFALVSSYQPYTSANQQASTSDLKIKQHNPVVNEGKQLNLSALDSAGNIAKAVTWSSGSPDIAQVDPQTGLVSGIKQGFATITAQQGNNTSSVFVVVARVRKAAGAKVPGDTKADANGHLYISNPQQNVILTVNNALNSPTQIFAGTAKMSGLKDGDKKDALFAGPTSISIDNSTKGGIYITDTLNHSIRKINFQNQVETLLGTGAPGIPVFDNQGLTNAQKVSLNSPRGIASDSAGNLFIADTDNQAIYYFAKADNQLVLLAGEPGQAGKADGQGQQARFQRPSSLALSNDGKLLTVADEDNNRVRIIEISRNNKGEIKGNVSTLGVATLNHNTTTGQRELEFDKPTGVGIDGAGNIYVVDNNGVQVVTHPFDAQLEVAPLAQPGESFNKAVSFYIQGNQTFVLDSQAITDAEAIKVVSVGAPEINSVTPSAININEPTKVVIKGQNFAPETVVTFGGIAVKDAQVISATEIDFSVPTSPIPGLKTISVLTRGGLAQRQINLRASSVEQLMPNQITTIAGGTPFTGDGGLALETGVGCIGRLTQDSLGNLFFIDSCFSLVRRVDSQTGIITTVAGGGSSTQDGVLANTATLSPVGLIVDKEGNLLIGDPISQSIRKLNLTTNIITTLVTSRELQPFITSDFTSYNSFAFRFDQSSNLVFTFNNRVLRLDNKTNKLSSIAGTDKAGFAGDGGLATQSTLNQPRDIEIDNNNNIYIADTSNNRIRRIDKEGVITTVLGNGICEPDNKASATNLCTPSALVLDNKNTFTIGIFANLLNFNVKTKKLSSLSAKTGTSFLSFSNIANTGKDSITFANNQDQILKLEKPTRKITPIVSKKRSTENGTGVAADASFSWLLSSTIDNQGNIYISDVSNTVRKIDATTKLISTIAKDTYQINNLTTDTQGKLYATQLNTIVTIDPLTGKITLVAGSREAQSSGDGGNALKANLGNVVDIKIDSKNNIFIFTGDRLRRIDGQTNIISTIATLDPPLYSSGNLQIDSQGNIYFADFFKSIVLRYNPQTNKIAPYAGVVGNLQEEFSGAGGLAINAKLGRITSITLDNQDNLIIAAQQGSDLKTRLWRVNRASQIIEVFLDGNRVGYAGDGGEAQKADFSVFQLMTTPSGDLLFINYNELTTAGLRVIKH